MSDFDWASAIADAAIVGGLAFFSTITALMATGNSNTRNILLVAGIAAGLQFFLYLAGKRGLKILRNIPQNTWIEQHAWILAQEVHVSLGSLFVFAAKCLFNAPLIGAIVILVVAIIKEFSFDRIIEKDPFFWNGLIDWSVYWLGVAIAAVSLAVVK